MTKSTIAKAVEKIERLPAPVRNRAFNFMIGRAVPFVSTAGLRIEKATANEWVAHLDNKRKVQNHLKQIHACGMLLIGETVAVMIMAMNLPGDRIPLVKKIEADFVKRSTGSMTGVVTISDQQIAMIKAEVKGEIELDVAITDEADVNPVLIKVTAAWVPKDRSKDQSTQSADQEPTQSESA